MKKGNLIRFDKAAQTVGIIALCFHAVFPLPSVAKDLSYYFYCIR